LTPSLLCAALAAVLVAGCTSTTLDEGLQAGAGYSYAGGTSADMAETATADLPETMPMPAFAGSDAPEGVAVAALSTRIEDNMRVDERAAEPLSPDLDRLIAKYAALYAVPEALVRRVIKRESNYRPAAYNKGNWGLMQIRHATARGMGYDGPAKGLLDAETNLKYAVKYLRGAWLVAKGDADRAVRFYASGYYYDAKRMGLLEETGLGKDRIRKRV
jgi:soluble lytic murein transglycosylase-like protein